MSPATVRCYSHACAESSNRRQIPRKLFQQAVALAQPFNVLYDKIGRDTEWLLQTLEKCVSGVIAICYFLVESPSAAAQPLVAVH